MNRATLENLITSAFPDVDPPKEVVAGGGPFDPEAEEVARAFDGKRWAQVTPELVRENKDALPLLTPEAFYYYFPAYMLACVRARDLVDTAWDSAIFNLTPPSNRNDKQWQRFLQRGRF